MKKKRKDTMIRRGQVTVFIILGIVIVAVVLGAIFLLKPKISAPEDKAKDYESVSYLANSCLETSAKKAIWQSFNSGFYDETDTTADIITYNESFYDPINSSNIYVLEQIRPVYLNKGTMKMPTYTDAEKVISKKFNKDFNNCIEKSNISLRFKEFTLGETTSRVELNNENVVFKVNTNITLNNKDTTNTITSLTYTLDYPAKKKYDNVKAFVERQSKNEAFVISHLSVLAKTNDFFYNLAYNQDNIIKFEFIYNDYENIGGEKLIYGFAIKYDWPNTEEFT